MDQHGGPPERWHDDVAWWEHPSLAYVKGLLDGLHMGCPDCAHADDTVHRAAVKTIRRLHDMFDAREAHTRKANAA